MATKSDGEDFFPKKIYAPAANPGDASIGIDVEGKHVVLEPASNNACIGIMGVTGSGKSVLVQSVIEQYARGGAEVLYCDLLRKVPGNIKSMSNVVYTADNVESTLAAVRRVADVLSERQRGAEKDSHKVVLVIECIDELMRRVRDDGQFNKKLYDTVDFIRRGGTRHNVVLVFTSQTMSSFPTGPHVSRLEAFGSLIVAGGSSTTPIPFPGAESTEGRLPNGRCVYFTESGSVEFQAFMPNDDVSTIPRLHRPLVQQLVPSQ